MLLLSINIMDIHKYPYPFKGNIHIHSKALSKKNFPHYLQTFTNIFRYVQFYVSFRFSKIVTPAVVWSLTKSRWSFSQALTRTFWWKGPCQFQRLVGQWPNCSQQNKKLRKRYNKFIYLSNVSLKMLYFLI